MRLRELMVHCMAWREGDQWIAVCLEFNLAAQDDSFDEVKARLNSQIRSYLLEALVGEDSEHAGYLIHRRAPLHYWLTYYLIALQKLLRLHIRGAREYSNPVPMAPA